ncbi:MAG: EamA family transporter [Parcubacteria group bacterium]|jgi:drug/metabolite transporter (DMT)-like permease
MWILYSLIGAFSQALGAAFKKKALQTPGMNNVIGFISFAFAGIIFWLLYFSNTETFWIENLSHRFWGAMFWYAGLNIIAAWFLYRALDLAEFNHLMPFMTLTSLTLIIPPIFILGEVPSLVSILGIILIVSGVLYINYNPSKVGQPTQSDDQRKANRKGVLYFLVTAICYTITPTAAKITVQESSAMFASAIVHLLVGLGFLGMIIALRELPRLSAVLRRPTYRKLFLAILVTGIIIVFENGSINTALSTTSVAYVFAIKRLMPFFAFLIGLFYFKEKTDLKKKILATALMVAGAVIVTLFG